MTTQLNFFDLPSETERKFPKEFVSYVRSKNYELEFSRNDFGNYCKIRLPNGFLMVLNKFFIDHDPQVYLQDENNNLLMFDSVYKDNLTDEECFKFLKILETKKTDEETPLWK